MDALPLLAEALPLTPIWLTEPGIVPGVPRRPLARLRRRVRRVWFWLTGFNWWAISAIVVAVVGAGLAFTNAPVNRVLAVGVFALVLAVIAPREH